MQAVPNCSTSADASAIATILPVCAPAAPSRRLLPREIRQINKPIVGTCRLGSGQESVTDTNLRFPGNYGLGVVDNSVVLSPISRG
ncbi:GMC oxidoreductase [Mesorhizobium sp.]|uniref:GMC oxidoreductase n=1 Tax=Mesorhizobium sp. TaxID=1871066 RepID=UPI00344B62FF